MSRWGLRRFDIQYTALNKKNDHLEILMGIDRRKFEKRRRLLCSVVIVCV